MLNGRRTIVATGLALLLAGFATAQPVLDNQALDQLGYTKFWETQLDLNRARGLTGVYLLDDTLYVVTDSGDVHCLQASAGLSRWAQNIAESAYAIYPPTHFVTQSGDAMTAFSTSRRVLIVDRHLGEVVQDMLLEKALTGSAAVAEDAIYFGSADGHFYAMRWTDPRTTSAVMLWRVMAGGPVAGAPLLINNNDDVVFASQDGSVYCCTAAAKLFNWRSETGGPITGELAIDGPSIFTASNDRSLYSLESASGAQNWRLRFPVALTEGPVAAGGLVFQYGESEGVAAVDAQSGKLLWINTDARRFVSRGIDYVILQAQDGDLLKLSAEDGTLITRAATSGIAVPAQNVQDGTLYLASNQGRVMCAKPAGSPHLTPQELAEARRSLHTPNREPTGAAAVETPDRRPPEPGLLDPKDPLRSPSDRPSED